MHFKIRVEFDTSINGTVKAYDAVIDVRAVSRKHALNKALARVKKWAIYRDTCLDDVGMENGRPYCVEATILG